MDSSDPTAYGPGMQITLDKKPTPAASTSSRTTFSLRVYEVAPGQWTADLAPDGKHAGVLLRGPGPREVMQSMLEFLFA